MRLVEYLFFRPGPVGPVFEQWGNVLAGAYVALALSFLVLGALLRTFSARHALHTQITRKVVGYGLGLQLLGLLVLGLRVVDWPFFSMRLWLYLHLIGVVAAVGYLLWWMQNRYPDLLAEYEWEQKKRAYLPRAAGGSVAPARRRASSSRRR